MRSNILSLILLFCFTEFVFGQNQVHQPTKALKNYIDVINQVGQISQSASTGFFNYQLSVVTDDQQSQLFVLQMKPIVKSDLIQVEVRVPQQLLGNSYFDHFLLLQLDLFFNTFQYFHRQSHATDLRFDMQKFIYFAKNIPRLQIPVIVDDLNDLQFRWTTPHSAYEIYQNMNTGSLNAQLYFAQHRLNSLQILKNYQLREPDKFQDAALKQFLRFLSMSFSHQDHDPSGLDQVIEKMKFDLEKRKLSAKKNYTKKMKQFEQRKLQNQDLLKNTQLAELVKMNDRKRVAEIIEIILPWEVFEPSEYQAWKSYVNSIRNPDSENTFVMYRGSDSQDKLQLIIDAENNVTDLAVFAKKITAGSGSHLHRISDIPHLLERNGILGNTDFVPPYEMPHTLSAMVTNHSINPLGSLFISWSLSPDIAFRFLQSTSSLEAMPKESLEKIEKKYLASSKSGAVIAAQIDRRRLFINSFSGYRQELEVVAPLIVFPDEVIHFEKGLRYVIYQNGQIAKMVNRSVSDFKAAVADKLSDRNEVLLSNQTTQKQIYHEGQGEFFSHLNQLNPQGLRCELIFL